MADARCWALTEGHIGMENQALGLAEAVGLPTEVKRLHPRWPWSRLPPRLWFAPLSAPGAQGDPLAPPWPDLLITCGKRATAPSAAIRRASGGRCFTVHIQVPPLPADRFDLVVVPAHDGLRGENVFVTRAAVHRVTREKLDHAAAEFAPQVASLPRPLVAVLIGGSNNRHRLTPDISRRLGAQLRGLAEGGAGLLVTPSRRTGEENERIIRAALDGTSAIVWDGSGDNPYFGWLGLADHIVVTCDSVSMVSEACATGKPIHLVALDGRSRRIDAFNDGLHAAGIARPFDGTLDSWTYPPPDDTARAAAEVRRRMVARQ